MREEFSSEIFPPATEHTGLAILEHGSRPICTYSKTSTHREPALLQCLTVVMLHLSATTSLLSILGQSFERLCLRVVKTYKTFLTQEQEPKHCGTHAVSSNILILSVPVSSRSLKMSVRNMSCIETLVQVLLLWKALCKQHQIPYSPQSAVAEPQHISGFLGFFSKYIILNMQTDF